LIDAQICERFGWTFTDLDQQDEVRVSRAVQMMNIGRAYEDVVSAIRQHRIEGLSAGHWQIYKMIRDADKEEYVN
jgi:hypothetical protein